MLFLFLRSSTLCDHIH